MTANELSRRIAKHPAMCQTWITAQPFCDDGGAFYLSAIGGDGERIGNVHVVVWDKRAMGQPETARLALRTLMARMGLDRVIAEIDTDNTLAVNFAKRIGGHVIGTVRQRRSERGDARDVILIDALPEDIGGR